MKLIATIHQKDIGGSDTPSDVKYQERQAARAVLCDDSGRVALLYGATERYYKLPGGGIEDAEDIIEALEREIIEEVGARCTIVAELGMTEEWRIDPDGALHQISYAYLAKVVGVIGEPMLTQDEVAEGFSVVWVKSLDKAVSHVNTVPEGASARVLFMTKRDAAILGAAMMLQRNA